jgi:hypothetical protein
MVDLQRSSYGEQYYLNVGLWLTDIAPVPPKVRERDLHVRLRVDVALEKAQAIRLAQALDLEAVLPSEQRTAVVTETLEGVVVPWLEQWSTIRGVGAAMAAGPLSKALVVREARALATSAA